MNYDIPKIEEFLFVPKQSRQDDPMPLKITESQDVKQHNKISCNNILQLPLTPTSETASSLSCKINAYGSGSDLSHKTSGYSSVSDTSSISIRSDSTAADYVGFDAYSKHTRQQSEGSEGIEMRILNPASTCLTILEQGEDVMDATDNHPLQQYQLLTRFSESEFNEEDELTTHYDESVLSSCEISHRTDCLDDTFNQDSAAAANTICLTSSS